MFKSLRWAMGLLGTIGVAAALAVAGQGYYFISKLWPKTWWQTSFRRPCT